MIRAGTTCTVSAFSCTIQSELPSVYSPPSSFNTTNVAWQDHRKELIIRLKLYYLLLLSWQPDVAPLRIL